MPVTVNGSVLTQTDVTDASPSTLTFTSTVLTGGDVVVITVAENNVAEFVTPAAPTGGTGLSWTQIINQQNTAAHFSQCWAYWTKVPSDQTSTITVTTTSTSNLGTAAALYRLSGVDQVTPIGLTDGFQGQTDPTGTDLQLAGTKAGSLIIAAASDWSAGTAALTISISNTTSAATDLNNLESGQFRAISNHGSQSGSTNQGTYDYSVATGDWAAIIFEVQAAPAAGGIQFRPGKTWKRRYKHRQRLPIPPSAGVDVRNDTALGTVGLSTDATVKKVAVVSAVSSLGLSGTATAAKVAKSTNVATVGLSSNFVHLQISAVTATSTLGLTSSSTAKKVTPTTSVGTVGLAGTVTAKKVTPATLRSTVGLAGIVTARKIAPATGLGIVGLQANFVHADIHPITALGGVGLIALATVKKRATPLAAGTLGLTGNALPKKISKSTGLGELPLATLAIVRKNQAVTGRGTIGLTAWWEILPVVVGGDLYVEDRKISNITAGSRSSTSVDSGDRSLVDVNSRSRDTADLSGDQRKTTTVAGG